MRLEARRMLANLLDRKGKNRGAGRRAGEGGPSVGRLSRSEPAIHALGPDLTRRPLNNAIVTRGARAHLCHLVMCVVVTGGGHQSFFNKKRNYRLTIRPSHLPTIRLSDHPTYQPSVYPTIPPTNRPFIQPSYLPTIRLSDHPTYQPSGYPTILFDLLTF
ncbi:hypothetical protein E2C01_047504 [Portunus trituberculatus]|uniref:Uncharacterized protein n=1 Tax=Portunus trituberculatus TaxID=210409 RepID=A0A5B7G8Q6_PORTR|nr:hypothetical protein [Portunus trituberculatus]